MDLSEALFKLMHSVRLSIGQQVKQLNLDLSPMHFKSLKVISKIDGCNGQKLADFLGRDKAQINRLIKELVNQELVIKSDDPNDKRSQLLSLSQQGEDIMSKFKVLERQTFNNMVQGVDSEQIEQFIEVANKLRSNISC